MHLWVETGWMCGPKTLSKKKGSQKLEIMSFIQQIVLFSIVHFLDNVEMISACCQSEKKKKKWGLGDCSSLQGNVLGRIPKRSIISTNLLTVFC